MGIVQCNLQFRKRLRRGNNAPLPKPLDCTSSPDNPTEQKGKETPLVIHVIELGLMHLAITAFLCLATVRPHIITLSTIILTFHIFLPL